MEPAVIVGLTVLSIGLYFLVFWLLVKIFYALRELCRRTKGPLFLIPLLLAVIVWIPVFILDLVHTIFCLILGIQAASALRDWWHTGVK